MWAGGLRQNSRFPTSPAGEIDFAVWGVFSAAICVRFVVDGSRLAVLRGVLVALGFALFLLRKGAWLSLHSTGDRKEQEP